METAKVLSLHDYTAHLKNSTLFCYRTCCINIVSRDHLDVDTSSLAISHCLRDTFSNRILNSENTDPSQVVVNIVKLCLRGIIWFVSDAIRWPLVKVPIGERY